MLDTGSDKYREFLHTLKLVGNAMKSFDCLEAAIHIAGLQVEDQ